MATTTAFGSLSVPAPDDTMEMSSPANRNLDDDIDIDFGDFSGGGVNLTEDERMLEDGETRPATATDEMMEDDELPREQSHTEKDNMQSQIDEEIMKYDIYQEVVQQPEDEELIDYGEDELQDEILDDTAPSASQNHAASGEIGAVQLGEESSVVVESALTEIPGVTLQDELSSEAAPFEEPTEAARATLDTEPHADDTAAAQDDGPETHEFEDPDVEERAADEPAYPDQEEDSLALPPRIDTAVSASTDTPGTPTDTGLHPMNIRYGDMLFPLFKSKRQPDGLLKGDNLVQLSLADLIKACRQRLALKIGEDVSEDQELVLGFEGMGLMLVEDCRAAFQSSLHDVLQVYLQLHENDGADDVPPLSLSLTMQLKFSSSFAILKEAAAGGQGMSTFNFLQSASGNQEYQEDFEGPGDLGPYEEHDYQEGLEGQHYGDGLDTFPEGAELDQQGDIQEHHPGGDHDAQAYDEYYEDGEHAGQDEEQFYIQEEDEAAVRLDELEEGHRYERGLLATAFEDPGVAADEVTVAKQQAESAATSTTAHGDSANNTAGEYDPEDYIDWDDDSLTTSLSEHDADAHEDFSTFITDYGGDESKDDLPEDVANQLQDQLPEHEGTTPGQTADHLGSEDLLNDPTGQEYGDEDYQGEETFEGEHGAGEHGEDYNFDQADTYDEQYDENHPDYQPGEDDEQYHTAHDFLNTEQYEHGLDQEHHGEEADGLDDTVGTVIHHETAESQEDFLEHDDLDNLGDDIGYDDADQAGLQNGGQTLTSGSPSGKRSFDELEDDLDDEDDREAKKVRAS